MKTKTSILAFMLLMVFQNAFAWGTIGHRVVAEIAENHLSLKAKKNLKKIIGNQKLAYWANWADFIKSDTTGVWKPTYSWHYLDLKPAKNFPDFVKELKAAKGPNLYTQIKMLSEQIKNKNTSPKDRRIALIFLIHLMGDMSQPLHVGREEDLGGNKINVKFFNKPTNLHSVWDDKLIDFQKYSYTEFAQVLDTKSPKEVKKIQSGTLEQWLYETQQATNKIYADIKPDENLKYYYNYKFKDLLEYQLLSGGLRLAKILNEVLK